MERGSEDEAPQEQAQKGLALQREKSTINPQVRYGFDESISYARRSMFI